VKLLLVLGSDDCIDAMRRGLAPMGYDLIRYRHVLKAMDNIDEVDPCAIVVSARDFPRHWKILVQFVRAERSKEACPIVLLKSAAFGAEETSKAFFLGVNGVLDDSLFTAEKLSLLQGMLGRRSSAREKRRHFRFAVEPWHRVDFLVADLLEREIVRGVVGNISSGGILFSPEDARALEHARSIAGANASREFRQCSLRAGEAILSPVCRLAHVGKTLSLEFVSFPPGEEAELENYIEETMMLGQGRALESIAC